MSDPVFLDVEDVLLSTKSSSANTVVQPGYVTLDYWNLPWLCLERLRGEHSLTRT